MTKEEIHHPNDVGYKHIFSHKQTFLELLRSFGIWHMGQLQYITV